jgi:opacity protein-like surface antigen
MTLALSLASAFSLVGAHAYAQEGSAPVGAGAVEISASPGGGTFFMKSTNGAEPKFDNYTLGASFIGNVNRFVGIEGDLNLALGRQQNLDFLASSLDDQKTPTMVGYNGSAIISPWGSDRRVAPYVAAGLGAMTMFNTTDVEAIGIFSRRTFLTTNVGAGLKWFPVAHWGVRGDYRYFLIRNNDDAPRFFGQEDRNAHRVYAGLVYTY